MAVVSIVYAGELVHFSRQERRKCLNIRQFFVVSDHAVFSTTRHAHLALAMPDQCLFAFNDVESEGIHQISVETQQCHCCNN